MPNKISKIIREEIKMLLEREAKSSVESSKVISMASKYGFFLPYTIEGEQKKLIFYYGGEDKIEHDFYHTTLQRNFDKFADMIKKCGWVINQCGTHYDGLREMYLRFEKEHPEFGVGTFFACVEPEYGTKMDDYFGNKENEILNNDDYFGEDDYWNRGFNMDEQTHYGITYHRGVFYHVTSRKYLRPILSHGLRPKNGGGITRWRNTTPRLYLSLLPDFSEVDFDDGEEEGENDAVILRIDLRSVMKNFDFYVDYAYNNAVFTYSNIPPNFIQVISNEEIRESHSRYYLEYAARQSLKRIVERNFSNCSEEEKRKKVNTHHFEISAYKMPKLVLEYFEWYNIDEKYKKYIKSTIENEIRNYINSEC